MQHSLYSSISSTSATSRWSLSARNVLIRLNTESLKPPMFMLSTFAGWQKNEVWIAKFKVSKCYDGIKLEFKNLTLKCQMCVIESDLPE